MIVFKPRLFLFYVIAIVLFAVLSNISSFKLEQHETITAYATIVENSR